MVSFRRKILFLALVVALFLPHSSRASSLIEYEVKASFLYNFTKFVDWPSSARRGDFSICVIGKDYFGNALDSLKDKEVDGDAIEIKNTNQYNKSLGCNIAFISKSEGKSVGDIIKEINGDPVLTVSDISDFAKNGGMLELRSEGEKVSISANPSSAKKSDIKISSRLLNLANIEGN